MTTPFIPPPLLPSSACIRCPRLASKAQDHILPSPLHPHVVTGHRFLAWLSPFGILSMNSELSTFPGHVIAHHHLFISQSVNKEMLSNYSAGLIHFTRFCNNFSIMEASRMLVSEALLATFITHWGADSVRPGTLKSWLLSIELWHNINGAPWNGAALLCHAISGAAKNKPSPSSVLKPEPVTLQHLQTLCRCLNLSNAFDAASFALACITFWCCCRLGKLIVYIEFEPSCHVSCSVVMAHGTASNSIHFANFHLPSKRGKRQ